MINAKQIIKLLKLKPLVREGGYYRETYRSKFIIPKQCLPKYFSSKRACKTAIFYMLTQDSCSIMHKLLADETYHFYLGDPVDMLLLDKNKRGRVVTLGNNIQKGQKIQFTIPKGVWQGAFLKKSGRFALLGVSVSPGFEFSDCKFAKRSKLIKSYPKYRRLIFKLTKSN